MPLPLFRRALAALALSALAAALHPAVAQTAAPPPPPAPGSNAPVVHITIDPAEPLARVTNLSFGVNTAIWDAHLTDPSVAGLVRKSGFTVMRYPGGSTSDEYHWRTHTTTPHTANGTPGGPFSPSTDFDHFIQLIRAAGAQPIVIVNYGSNATRTAGGDPAEAAAWVADAKKKGYNVKYWEIGNEVYGNGFYSEPGWETDLHAGYASGTRKSNPLLGPTEYGKNVVLFSKAMKAQDKSARIGAVLTAPLNWPDSIDPDWNTNVLQQCGHAIDFAIIHVYPQLSGHESDAGLLAQPAKNAEILAALRPKLRQYCGRDIPIFVTETNSVNTAPGKQSVSQVNALFAADDALTFLEAGAANVDWWALHNGPTTNGNNSPSLFGDAAFGDYGVLLNGDKPEPPANTPQRTDYAFQVLHTFAKPGDVLIQAKSDNSMVVAHASVAGEDYKASVLLINKSPTETYLIAFAGKLQAMVAGQANLICSPGEAIKRRIVANPQFDPGGVTLPPYTITTLTLAPAHRPSR